MGQISMEIIRLPGSLLSANQQLGFCHSKFLSTPGQRLKSPPARGPRDDTQDAVETNACPQYMT